VKNQDDAPSPEAEAEAATADEAAAPRSKRPGKKSRRREEQPKVAPKALSTGVVLGLVGALAVGGAGGWFGRDAQAKARLRAESVATPAGSGVPAGPCGAWEHQICQGTGDQSAACTQAKGAIGLLTPSTCEAALGSVPATLAKVKAERAPCDTLVKKLCTELTEASATCKMVREKTAAFPPDRCSAMLEHFPEVLGELKQMEQQQGMMGAPGGPGGPGGPRGPGGPGSAP
jgi:hypothetical protein